MLDTILWFTNLCGCKTVIPENVDLDQDTDEVDLVGVTLCERDQNIIKGILTGLLQYVGCSITEELVGDITLKIFNCIDLANGGQCFTDLGMEWLYGDDEDLTIKTLPYSQWSEDLYEWLWLRYSRSNSLRKGWVSKDRFLELILQSSHVWIIISPDGSLPILKHVTRGKEYTVTLW